MIKALVREKSIHLFLFSILICSFQVQAQEIAVSLQLQGKTYSGSVKSNWFDQITLHPVPPNKLSGAKGSMTGKRGSMHFEIAENATGSQDALMLKTNNGWYPLRNIEHTSTNLNMTFDWSFRPKFRPIDMVILETANQLISSIDDWNNEDDRQCEDDFDNKKWSLYCVMKQASIDVTGDFNHRGASLNEVRFSIMQKKPNAKYAHRLRDFNNEEGYDEVKDTIKISIMRMR